jgi:uncharacterized protein YndB with AHSA1/START domain
MTKTKLELEFIVHCSPHILFNCISNPSNLEEWYADSVNMKNNILSFKWEGEERQADLITVKKDSSIKWRWKDDGFEGTFCEMRIKIDEMTDEVALIVTDFCDDEDIDDTKMLWDMAIENLHRVIGR